MARDYILFLWQPLLQSSCISTALERSSTHLIGFCNHRCCYLTRWAWQDHVETTRRVLFGMLFCTCSELLLDSEVLDFKEFVEQFHYKLRPLCISLKAEKINQIFLWNATAISIVSRKVVCPMTTGNRVRVCTFSFSVFQRNFEEIPTTQMLWFHCWIPQQIFVCWFVKKQHSPTNHKFKCFSGTFQVSKT